MTEPRRIDQTKFGEAGDCFICCVAMLLGVDVSEIPADVSSADQFFAIRRWALTRGYRVVTFSATPDLVADQLAQGFVIASGKSSRGLPHAVIFKDGALWHDPHPSREGFERVDEVDLFIPLLPAEWSRA
jgi:hypothetical protein